VPGGPLAGSLGALVGVGPTRGIGVLLAVVGVFVLAVTVGMALVPHFRTADSIPLAPTPETPAPAEAAAEEEPAREPVPVPA
jgi:DHA3 family macrolide efflux protein-like MFS transporter